MKIQGATDLYEQMLAVQSGKFLCGAITKAHAKSVGIDWSFVEKSAALLGLKLFRDGSHGYSFRK